MILIDPERRPRLGLFGWRTDRGGDVDATRIPGRETARTGVAVEPGSGIGERRWNTGGGTDKPPPRDLTAPPGAAPQPEKMSAVFARFAGQFTPGSIEQARRVIFGFTPSSASTEAPIKSPLQNQFAASAHPHLLCYFMHRAMGEAEKAEGALGTFFEDINKQAAEDLGKEASKRVNTNRDIVNPSVINRIVTDAIALLQPK